MGTDWAGKAAISFGLVVFALPARSAVQPQANGGATRDKCATTDAGLASIATFPKVIRNSAQVDLGEVGDIEQLQALLELLGGGLYAILEAVLVRSQPLDHEG